MFILHELNLNKKALVQMHKRYNDDLKGHEENFSDRSILYHEFVVKHCNTTYLFGYC